MKSDFENKKVLVMGLGLHGGGISVVAWLLKHKSRVFVTDLKTKTQLKESISKISKLTGGNNVKYTLGKHVLKDFEDKDLIIQNPSVPKESKYLAHAKKKNIPIVNEAVMFFGLFDGHIIGVTGTRGKSTTSTITHKLLRKKIKGNVLAGNIAKTPMLSIVDKINKNSWPVVELSSWHLEGLADYKRSPHIAVVTNVMVDHINRYASYKEYQQAKFAITANQTSDDYVVLNADNKITSSFAKKTKAKVYYFSLLKKVKGTYTKKDKIYFFDGKKEQPVCPVQALKLPGSHNLANTLAAICVAKIIGIPNKNIKDTLENFRGVWYRLEKKGKVNGIEVFNDSTATNPDATVAALDALSDTENVLICGGMDKKLDFSGLAKAIKKYKTQVVLLPGTASEELNKKLGAYKNVYKVKTLAESWQKALSLADPKMRIVFSPGAASFNMFINEFDRARKFDLLIDASKKKERK